MKKIFSAREKVGLSPGTPVYTGDKTDIETSIDIITYSEKGFFEERNKHVGEYKKSNDADSVYWLNVTGLHDINAIAQICNDFNIHTLIQEDIVNTNQRPKVDVFDAHLVIALKMIFIVDNTITYEHVSLVLGEGYLITFQEHDGDVFKFIRERLKNKKGRIRRRKSDYLAYALIDAIVDNYFIVLEKLEERLEPIDNEVLYKADHNTLIRIHALKQDVNLLRRSIMPLREVVSTLLKEDAGFISESSHVFLKDLYDHVLHVLDSIDGANDSLAALTDLYMSQVSNRLNETMKVLTVTASIFIPLTFVAGIYGMNFENMPELKWEYGYFYVLFLMFSVVVLMLYVLKKKKWL